MVLTIANGINAAQNQIKDFLDYLEFYFTNSAIINPKIDFVKQYLYAINNTVLAKLKNLFLYYRTSSAITDLTKASFPTTRRKQEQGQTSGKRRQDSDGNSRLYNNRKICKNYDHLLYCISFYTLFFSVPPCSPVYMVYALSYCNAIVLNTR